MILFFLYAEMHEDLSSFYNETRKIMTLHINKELTDKLELPEIANDFISSSSHGNNYLENSDFNYYH